MERISMERVGKIERKTKETEISLELQIDGIGNAEVETGIGFFDHMLNSFAKHGFFDLIVHARGDLYVDSHHTVEDVGIALGQAIKEAVGNKEGIKRYGSFILPMDDVLVLCSVDLSGRPYFVSDIKFTVDKLGYMDTELVREFFYAISYSAGMNLHFKLFHGENNHHIVEGMFKAFAKALDEATNIDNRIQGVLSAKGTI